MTDRVGIETLCGLGLTPPELVRLAGELGVAHVSLGFRPAMARDGSGVLYDLSHDAAMRDEVRAAMRDCGVAVSLGEGCVLSAQTGARDLAERLFDPMLDLGVRRINVVSMDPDLSRTLDATGELVERALAAGFDEIVSEFAPVLTLRDLPMALAAIDHVGHPRYRLLIDTMHLARSGGTPADLAAIAPDRIGYIQLCDAPLHSDRPYMEEAMTERLAPGAGELPIEAMLAALPRDLVVSLELPQTARLAAGYSLVDTLRPAVAATRACLERLPPH
jgi:sugar phosphate isomerase/epimerase